MHLFARKLKRKTFFKCNVRKRCLELGLNESDLGDMDTIMLLLQKSEREPGRGPFTTLKNKSQAYPAISTHIDLFGDLVTKDLEKLDHVTRGYTNNLCTEERKGLV
ncbi:hypothetical protein GDO81_008370 [Engystomops pustulosus]|uniref:Uncharacterized protein n=1 Tax=Engystomops pustulosus TaxID=76066 RepID=A0AAV7CEB2_ENGPU|nr:hypothetical protein GDO81_008370 [Engystomops pustulosus]